MAGSCLTPSDIQEFLFGSLAPEDWARARAHLAECESCRLALAPLFLDERLASAGSDSTVHRVAAASRARDAGAAAAKGWTLGPYAVLNELGRGGQGQVYLAEDTRLARKVALKVLSATFTPSSSVFQRFQREALALSKLDHPGLCAVYDAGEIDGIAYIAMRFVEGETLAKRLSVQAQSEPQPPSERERAVDAVRIIERTARALHAAHEAGLVHRDVKPGNIMVTRDQEPVLLDFGLARDETGDLQTLTRSGDVMGTPAYMSPEQLSGGGTRLDRRTDVYSLGVTLYQCLTLRLPFEAPTREGLYQKILTGDPPDPRSLNAEVSRDLKVILETALEKSRERRYQTALELAEDLRRVREYEPIHARPAGPTLRFRRWTQRNPVLATSTIALFVVLAVALSISLVLLKRISFEEGEKGNALGREKAQTQALEVALSEKDKALLAKDSALTRTEALRLAAVGSGIASKSPGLALLLGLEADRKQRSLLATNTVLQTLGSLRERRALMGHFSSLTSVRLSPDGRHVVTAGFDDTARVWEITTGRQVALLYGHTMSVNLACFDRAGTRIYTASADATARIWQFPGGRCLRVLKGHSGPIVTLDISPDGKRLVTGARDGTAKVWSTSTGALLANLPGHSEGVSCVKFSPDGRWILTCGYNSAARLWDLRMGMESRALSTGGPESVTASAFSPDGRWVLTLDAGFTKARVWDLVRGSLLFETEALNEPLFFVEFSPDGQRFLLPIPDHAVRVFETGTWRPACELRGHLSGLCTARFSFDGKRIVTTSSDRTARIWDADSGVELAVLEGHSDAVMDACFTSDGRQVITASADGSARIWDVDAPNHDIVVLRGAGSVQYLAVFSPDGREVLIAEGNLVQLYDTLTGQATTVFRGHQHNVIAAAYSPDGKLVATGTNGTSVRIWDARSGKARFAIMGRDSGVQSVCFAPDGRKVLVVFFDGNISLWETSGKQVWSLDLGDKNATTAAALSSDGESVFIVHKNGAKVVSASDGTVVASLDGKPLGTGDVQLSRDGRLAEASPWGDTVYLIDARDCRLIAEIKGYSFGTLTTRFSPDGKRIVTACMDSTARVWDIERGKFSFTLKGHEGAVLDTAFSPDGNYILTGSSDCTARLWDAATGAELCTFKGHRDRIRNIDFSPDGQRILTSSDDGTVRIWPTDPFDAARRRAPRALTPDERDLYEVGSPEQRRFRRNVWDLKQLVEDLWLSAKASLCR